MRKKLIDCTAIITTSLGVSGLVITTLGAAGLILGLSGKVAIRLGETLKTHESTINKMVTYGGNVGIIGLCSATGGAAIAWLVGDKLDCFGETSPLLGFCRDGELANPKGELEEAAQKHHCSGCVYFSANPCLPCAVNPHLPKNCRDFTVS